MLGILGLELGSLHCLFEYLWDPRQTTCLLWALIPHSVGKKRVTEPLLD